MRPAPGLRHQLLTGTFRHDDQRVLAAREPLLERRQEPLERERHLRNQAEIHVAVDQGRIRRDEARVAAHELHEPDPVAGRFGLGVGGVGRAPRFCDGRVESERPLHEGNVVVDRLGHADDADRQAAPRRFLADRLRPAQRPVPADRKEHPDAELVQVLRHFGRVLRAAGRSEHRSAALVDPVHGLGRQFERLVPKPADQAFVAETKAVDLRHAVLGVQVQDDGADDVVQSGAEASAGHDPAREPRRIEEQHAPRAGGLHGRRPRASGQAAVDSLEGRVVEHPFIVGR